jgi:nitrite reductase/ring-hydroxylating ferredoxin subunit
MSMPDEEPKLDRRRFLGVCACAVAGTALASGCASLAIRQVDAINGRLVLPLLQYPELTEAGGSLAVAPRGQDSPVFVFAVGERRFVALSPICTHLGCTVEIQGERLVCPCHGSTYDREGRVLRGPAERALHSYPATVTRGDVLEIDLTRTPPV